MTMCIVLLPEVASISAIALKRHRESKKRNALTVVVSPRLPPTTSARNDGEVSSFIASGPVATIARTLLANGVLPAEVLFETLMSIMYSHVPFDLVVEAGTAADDPRVQIASTITAIVPHRGPQENLLGSITSLTNQLTSDQIVLCIDDLPNSEINDCLNHLALPNTYYVKKPPIGPYNIRQYFAMRSTSELIAFQDSDDISTSDRLLRQWEVMENNAADVVGSHELRLVEDFRRVFAIRYPVDVNAAVSRTASFAQLFPTTIVKKSFFETTGGLSTKWKIASDTQFLLRSHFLGRLLNVDAFLYVRRLRANSLTSSRRTGWDSFLRRILDEKWTIDFHKVESKQVRERLINGFGFAEMAV